MAAKEAEGHMREAEKALKPSWMSLKFNPDYTIASMEYSQAATKYRAATMLPESVQAWVKAAETKIKALDQFGAGRAYESAGQICDGGAAGGQEAAIEHWTKAIRCFRLAGKSDIAAKLILKLAVLYDKQKNLAKAKEAYEDVIDLYTDDGKDYNLGDVYKSYIGLLVTNLMFLDALKAMDAHADLLVRQGHFPFAHKEFLSKAVVLLHMKDTVGAEEALAPRLDVQGWFTSKECQVGHELIAAFRDGDAEAVAAATKEQTFTFLQVEVARLAKQLRVNDARPVSVPTPAAGSGAGGYTATPPAAASGGGGYASAEANTAVPQTVNADDFDLT